MKEEVWKELLARIERSAFQWKLATPSDVTFSEDVVNACKANYCGRYGTCWTCPPGVGKLEDLKVELTKFSKVLVFTTKNDIEDSFDFEGMMAAQKKHHDMQHAATRGLDLGGGKVLGAEGCNLCKKCTYPDAPCRFPEEASPSVEACGIDVVRLASTCGINYHNGPNTVTFFSAIFFD